MSFYNGVNLIECRTHREIHECLIWHTSGSEYVHVEKVKIQNTIADLIESKANKSFRITAISEPMLCELKGNVVETHFKRPKSSGLVLDCMASEQVEADIKERY